MMRFLAVFYFVRNMEVDSEMILKFPFNGIGFDLTVGKNKKKARLSPRFFFVSFKLKYNIFFFK
jgi:hypothetical protein